MDTLKKDRWRLYFSGALNLDMIYEIGRLDAISRALDMEIRPGGEYIVSHREIKAIEETIRTEGVVERYVGGGGSSANTCVILNALGFTTAFIGSIGEDDAGELVLSDMKGVDIKLVKRDNKTARCMIFLTKDVRDRTILVAPGTEAFYTTSEGELSDVQLLHLSSLPTEKGLDFHTRLVGSIGDEAILSLDPGEIYSRLGKDALAPILKRTHLLFITQREYETLFGSLSPWEALEFLNTRARGPARAKNFNTIPMIVIKKGAKGAGIYASDGIFKEAPATPVDHVVDNTGAGDAFNAGFLSAWLRGQGLEACLFEGNRIAALSLSDWGRRWIRRIAES